MHLFVHYHLIFLILLFSGSACTSGTMNNAKLHNEGSDSGKTILETSVKTGADQIPRFFPLLRNKKIGLVVNQTSVVNQTHLVDTLLQLGIKIEAIFAPEHGFRGDHSAGAHVKSSTDIKTGIPIHSLYGKSRRPDSTLISSLDLVVFDIQDVGVRFYTYISTMQYMMEACAKTGTPFMVLDRPNPNGHYVDGPVLKMEYKSFVGMHPVPLVHGMTVGEFALMINGEGWVGSQKTHLTVIECLNYTHQTEYNLPIRPSPNLPNMKSIYLYPSLGLIEGVDVSLGRGTPLPFQWLGTPYNTELKDTLTPRNIPGVAENPPFVNQLCYGQIIPVPARNHASDSGINLEYLKYFYRHSKNKSAFFNAMFNKLAGNEELKQQIINNVSDKEIRESWNKDLEEFRKTRTKYLLYP